MKNKIVRQYLKEVKSNVVCETGSKGFIIRELQQGIVSFAEETPDLTLQDLYAEFGTPKEFALHLSDREDFPDLIKMAKKKAFLWRCLGIAGIVLAVVAFICAIIVINDFSGTVYVSDPIL